MIIQVYEEDEFTKDNDASQRLIYFESTHHKERREYSFDDFIKDCMTKEMLVDSFYNLNIRSNINDVHKMITKSYRDEIYPVDSEEIKDIEKMLNCVLLNNNIKIPKSILKSYCIYDHEWDYFFYIIEGDDGYYGYNWSSEAKLL